eukprot:3522781-Amphidinium_carterae.1
MELTTGRRDKRHERKSRIGHGDSLKEACHMSQKQVTHQCDTNEKHNNLASCSILQCNRILLT